MNHLLDHRIIVWGHSWCEGIFSTSFNVIHSLFLSDTNGILMITCLVTISKTKVNWKKITYPHSLIRDNNMSPSKLLKLNFSYLLKDKDRMQLTRYTDCFFSDTIDKIPETANCSKGRRGKKCSGSLFFSVSLSSSPSKQKVKLWAFYKDVL